MHIKVPGSDEYLYIYGFGVVENSIKATFNSSKLVDQQNLPEKVEVYWGPNGEQLIGEMNCMPYSEKVEHDLDDEVLEQDTPIQEESERTTEVASNVPEKETSSKDGSEITTVVKDDTTSEEKVTSSTRWIIIGAVILIVIVGTLFLF